MDDAEHRADAIKRLKRRRDLMGNIGSYVFVNGLLWLIWGLTGADTSGLPWPAWVSIIWGFIILMHWVRVFVRKPIDEAAIQREMAKRRST
ncbi:MAG: 2TM domain-containing protein [Actinobacteria bacterium]|nr:2TM domain-containing protein [Actinomycetota bacterium]